MICHIFLDRKCNFNAQINFYKIHYDELSIYEINLRNKFFFN